MAGQAPQRAAGLRPSAAREGVPLEPSTVLVEREGAVARVIINRPEARNALDLATAERLAAALLELGREPGLCAVVLRGAGESAFCAGADLKELAAADGVLERRAYFAAIGRVLRAVAHCEVPVIAAVRGYALAGGCGLVAACDLAVAAEDAVFGLPELRVGLFPMMVMAPVVRAVGRRRALELLFTGRRIDGREAAAIGLVNRAVPASEVDAAVQELAATLAASSPAAVRLGKRASRAIDGLSLDQALDYLEEAIAVAASTRDALEGVAAFLERRPPRWRGS